MKANNTMLRATFAVLLAVTGVSLLTTGVTAQDRSHDRILFLVPVPQQAEDSMWVHEMTDRLRNRAQNKFRHKWQVIQKDVITELLINSGFDSLTIVGAEMAEQFARPLIPIIDRGYILENGMLSFEGGRDELFDNPDVRSAYFGVDYEEE